MFSFFEAHSEHHTPPQTGTDPSNTDPACALTCSPCPLLHLLPLSSSSQLQLLPNSIEAHDFPQEVEAAFSEVRRR